MCELCKKSGQIVVKNCYFDDRDDDATLWHMIGCIFVLDSEKYKKQAFFEFYYCPKCGKKLIRGDEKQTQCSFCRGKRAIYNVETSPSLSVNNP